MFPKTRPTVAQLLDYVPEIRPRLYSIASASRLHGEDSLHLLIVADDWTTPSGVYKHGLCTQYLRALEPTEDKPVMVPSKVNPAAVLYPEDLSVPLILSGLGTGLAPLRAALEERVAAVNDGEKVGPVALFFGSRHEVQEFPYGDEFKKYVEMGVLTKLCTAFSRDQAHKIYVQDRVKEEAKMIYDFLITQNGNFYYCGTGGSAVDSIQQAVEAAFVSEGGMTPKEASDLVLDMRIKGRYNVESW
jgi:sulfite reductase (NADPH) flavoprotein alpha-component